MTSEEFRKMRFHANTLIEYHFINKEKKQFVYVCSISEVDFEEEIITLCPLDAINPFTNTFQVNIR